MSCKNCLAINHMKAVVIPEENEYINFQNFQKINKTLPLTISILAQTPKNNTVILFAVMAST